MNLGENGIRGLLIVASLCLFVAIGLGACGGEDPEPEDTMGQVELPASRGPVVRHDTCYVSCEFCLQNMAFCRVRAPTSVGPSGCRSCQQPPILIRIN